MSTDPQQTNEMDHEETGEYIGVVGNSFNCASHPDFFHGISEVIQDNRTADELEGAIVKSFSSRNKFNYQKSPKLPFISHYPK